MPLWKIAWRSIQRRGLASALTAFSMGLGVMLVVAVLLLHGVVDESFRSNASLGYNLILGPKGGKLQLVLNTVYYLSEPVENIPYSFYTKFLPSDSHPEGIDGEWAAYVDRVIPVCLGDYYQQYRVVGTTHEMFDNYVYDEDTGEKYEFAAGRNFEYFNEEHGFFEAIVGAKVARDTGLKIGDKVSASHGAPTGRTHEDQFVVVGILDSTGTPNDRAVFVNMEGFYLLDGHAKPVEDAAKEKDADEDGSDVTGETNGDVSRDTVDQDETSSGDAQRELPSADENENEPTSEPAENTADETGRAPEPPTDNETERPASPQATNSSLSTSTRFVADEAEHSGSNTSDGESDAPEPLPSYLIKRTPLPLEQREVTALLVRAPVRVTRGMSNMINEGNVAQAVFPVGEITSLLDKIVRPVQQLLLVLTATICVVSGVSILVSIYNSMNDRRREIAIMRSLGAGRTTVMGIVLLEAIMLALGGGLFGWFGGHLLLTAASPMIESETGVSVGLFDVAPTEWILVPALVLLSIAVGFLPAISAYRTDVADALTANP